MEDDQDQGGLYRPLIKEGKLVWIIVVLLDAGIFLYLNNQQQYQQSQSQGLLNLLMLVLAMVCVYLVLRHPNEGPEKHDTIYELVNQALNDGFLQRALKAKDAIQIQWYSNLFKRGNYDTFQRGRYVLIVFKNYIGLHSWFIMNLKRKEWEPFLTTSKNMGFTGEEEGQQELNRLVNRDGETSSVKRILGLFGLTRNGKTRSLQSVLARRRSEESKEETTYATNE